MYNSIRLNGEATNHNPGKQYLLILTLTDQPTSRSADTDQEVLLIEAN